MIPRAILEKESVRKMNRHKTAPNRAADRKTKNRAADRRTRNRAADRKTRNPAADRRTRNPAADRWTRNLVADRRTRNLAADHKTKNPAADRKTKNLAADRRTKNRAVDHRTKNRAVDHRTKNPAETRNLAVKRNPAGAQNLVATKKVANLAQTNRTNLVANNRAKRVLGNQEVPASPDKVNLERMERVLRAPMVRATKGTPHNLQKMAKGIRVKRELDPIPARASRAQANLVRANLAMENRVARVETNLPIQNPSPAKATRLTKAILLPKEMATENLAPKLVTKVEKEKRVRSAPKEKVALVLAKAKAKRILTEPRRATKQILNTRKKRPTWCLSI